MSSEKLERTGNPESLASLTILTILKHLTILKKLTVTNSLDQPEGGAEQVVQVEVMEVELMEEVEEAVDANHVTSHNCDNTIGTPGLYSQTILRKLS